MVFVICSKYPMCDGPGVAMYGDDYLQHHTIEEQSCGFCSGHKLVPMRAATDDEINGYRKRNPNHFPAEEPEEETE